MKAPLFERDETGAPTFIYTPSEKTDIRETFERERRRLAALPPIPVLTERVELPL